jgi:hypothetical protein
METSAATMPLQAGIAPEIIQRNGCYDMLEIFRDQQRETCTSCG